MIGSKKTKVEPKLSFADRLGKVKSMFVSAYNEADSLSKEMLADIEKDKETIKTIEVRIADTSELMKNTEAYMNKLKEFI
ncbi:nuclear pore complex-type fold protein [uncultured phage cr18_1]|uniref:Nuclear pore complex-type fold protein n=1 Tax=uncultured phage cr18_1 TaxID=2986407 RepID=A0AAE7RVF9_9CAUD|nr:nuclear pore complex-type fold protein [uncultured phage cr18_1]QWM90106.1 nuclear pore complex-type fold protein [uncultured phage cr18_1]